MSMARLRRVLYAATGLMVALFITVSVLAAVRRSHASPPTGVPAPLAAGSALSRPRAVPVMTLIGADGRPMSTRSWRGRYVILAPSMTLCHEVCPMTTAVLDDVAAQVRRSGLSKQVVVATATVDPWRDTPSRLRAYTRLTGAGYQMLTGTTAQIHRLWKFFGVYYHRVPQGHPADVDWLTNKPETFDVQHTDALFLLDPAGQERIADEGMPQITGALPVTLRRLLNDQGRQNLAHPQFAWSASDVIDDLYYLMNRKVPATQAGQAGVSVTPPTPAAAQAALAGSPAALAAVHRQAAQLLGSDSALRARLATLRGYPVVINAWASWCPPCRAEFPLFSAASARFGRKVAFLGVNINDDAANARGFLASHQVSYPSYEGSSNSLSWLAEIEGMPTTIFISPAGKVVDVHIDQYQTEGTLVDDIQRYGG